MARPTKKGLDYFPLNVDFLQDLKLRKIVSSCGAQSVAILIYLLGNIYKDNGYYMQWEESDLPFLIAGDIAGVKDGAVTETVKKACQVGFFDQDLLDKYQILTSKGIQLRFLEAVSRRKSVDMISEYLLVPKHDLPVSVNINLGYCNNNHVNCDTNQVYADSGTQSKVKESKVKKSKVDTYCRVVDYLNEKSGKNFRHTSNKTQALIDARLNEGFAEDDFFAVIDKKAQEWRGDPKMDRFLRPETLFGPKFEGYLNENSNKIKRITKKQQSSPDFEEREQSDEYFEQFYDYALHADLGEK
jgi:uncharacterized phage protein (TIGR02220 family)